MNAINPADTQAASGTTTTSSSGLPNSQGLNNMFLQLLVAQLQNQSPLDPMDPTQFVGQLAQFSELSEITQIDQILQQLSTSSSSGGSKPHATGQSASPATSSSLVAPDGLVRAAVSAAQAKPTPLPTAADLRQ